MPPNFAPQKQQSMIQRSFSQETNFSQETEAPLSDDAYDFLVEGLEADGNMRGDSIFNPTIEVKNEPAERIGAALISPPHSCAQSMTLNIPMPPLTRTYSLERRNNVPLNPSRVDYPGLYNFTLIFDEQQTISKSMPWTFSRDLNKLMCKINNPVPVKFHLEGQIPGGCYIRGILLCQDDDNVVIKTCARHVEEINQNGGNNNVTHMLQSNNPCAIYGVCQNSGRHSVRFPVLPFQAGVSYQTESFSFTCFSSCFRREVEAIFTLEVQGEVLGRRAIGIRVCACPGRDRLNLEQKHKMSKKVKKRGASSDDSEHKCHCKRKSNGVSTAMNSSAQFQKQRFWVLSTPSFNRYTQFKEILKAIDLKDKIDSSELPNGEVSTAPSPRNTSHGREWTITIAEKKKSAQVSRQEEEL